MRVAVREKINELLSSGGLLADAVKVEYGINVEDLGESDTPAVITQKINKALHADEVTLRDMLITICKDQPSREMITFDGEKHTCSDVLENTESLAAGFVSLGIKKGTKVAIILDNCLEFIYSYFALFYIGALPVPINIRWKKDELYRVLDNAEVSFIICSEKAGSIPYGEYVAEYSSANSSVDKVIYLRGNQFGDKGILFSSLMNEKRISASDLDLIAPDDLAMISYTSGTTGMPKGVLLKNNDIYKISKLSAEYWCSDRKDKPFSIAPLYSAQGFLSLLINVATECPFKMISSFNPNDIIREISKCENTIIHTQPTMWNLLLNCRIIDFAKFDTLEKLVVSGSLCSPALAKKIEERMNCQLMNAYGLIEGTSVVTMTRLDDPEDVRMNTVGRVIEGVEIKIVDSQRNEVPHGEIGELAVRGYNMAGYYKNPEKTSEVIDDEGWLYTGDLARYYDSENISIVGRCKDMIIRGGFNVYPSDIEEYLLQAPNVQNASVVGRPHEILGEEIVAFVLRKAGSDINERDILKFLFNKVSNYKMPDKVYFVSELPIILAGKIDKKVLSDWAVNGIPEDKQVLFEK